LLQLLLLLLVLLFELFQLFLLALLNLLLISHVAVLRRRRIVVRLIPRVVVPLVSRIVAWRIRRLIVWRIARPIVWRIARIGVRRSCGISVRRIAGIIVWPISAVIVPVVPLFYFLLLLHLLLLDSLPFAVLLLAEVFEFLLVLLFELRIHVALRTRRTIVVSIGIAPIAAVRLNVVVGDRLWPVRIVSLLRRTILLVCLILLNRLVRVHRIHLIGLVLAILDCIPAIVLRWHLTRRRRNTHIRPRGLRLHLARFDHTNGPSAICLNGLLLPHKRHRCGRRSRLRDNRAAREVSSWPYASFRACSQNAALLRHNSRTCRCNWRRSDFPRIHAHHVASDWLRGCERCVRSGGHGVINVLVLVSNVGDVHRFIHVDVVVDVRDLRAINDDRV